MCVRVCVCMHTYVLKIKTFKTNVFRFIISKATTEYDTYIRFIFTKISKFTFQHFPLYHMEITYFDDFLD